MGCTNAKGENHRPLRVPTRCGILKINILNCHLERNPNAVMTIDPYVKVTVSNQTFRTETIKKGGFQTKFNAQHIFTINSSYQVNGRFITISAMDQNKISSDKIVGYGSLDLDSIIQHQNIVHQLKARLSYDCEVVGFVNFTAQFIEEHHNIVSFRFESVQIKRRTSVIGAMNCWVKLTIGEQVLETTKSKDTAESPPVWNQQSFQVLIPKSTKIAKIEVFDQTKLVGDADLQIQQYLEIKTQKNVREIVRMDNIESAILCFSILAGQKSLLIPDKKDYRKSLPESKLIMQTIKEEHVNASHQNNAANASPSIPVQTNTAEEHTHTKKKEQIKAQQIQANVPV